MAAAEEHLQIQQPNTIIEFLNLCQDKTNALTCSESLLKKSDTSAGKCAAHNSLTSSHLTVITSLTEHYLCATE
jgi:hypothetical protein